MNRLEHFRSSGMGNLGITKSQTAGAVIGTSLTTVALFDPEPISKAALLVIGSLTSLITNQFSGCGQTCVQATAIVNQVEPYLKQNVANYLAIKTPRPASVQQAALSLFDSTWQQVLAACGNAQLGDAGKRCISDRQPGGKWDWFSYYRNPIANDTNVYDDSVLGTTGNFASGVISEAGSLVSGMSPQLLIGLGVLALGFVMFGGKK